jgi:hypothetical protein
MEDVTFDAQTISDAVDQALAMQLNTSTRVDIDARTAQVIGFMAFLLAQDLGAEDNVETMAHVRTSHRLLDLTMRPTARTPAHEAFTFLREVAIHTRTLLMIYRRRNGISLS